MTKLYTSNFIHKDFIHEIEMKLNFVHKIINVYSAKLLLQLIIKNCSNYDQ